MLILKVFLTIDLFLIIFIMLNKIAIYKIFLKYFEIILHFKKRSIIISL